jgi:hypothetical protein
MMAQQSAYKKSLFSSKKGSFYQMIVYFFEHAFFRVLFLIVALVTTVLVIHSYIVANLDTSNVEERILYYDLFYSPQGFSYTDEFTGRTYAGVVDLSRFNTETLDKAAGFPKNSRIGAHFVIKDESGVQQAEAYLNKAYFKSKYPLAKAKTIGTQSAVLYTKITPVTTISHPAKSYERSYGILVAEIIVKKR